MIVNETSDTKLTETETNWALTDVESYAQVGVIDTEGLNTVLVVVNVALSATFCLFGIVFNIINIKIFYRQGLNNTVNISMFAIAISDLCSLFTLEWWNINFNPFMENSDIFYEPFDMLYITGGWLHTCFLQITICITVYVTAERFVCIALPLKVKQIFTPLRTKVVVGLIYFLIFLAVSPEYIYFYFGENFYIERNQTRIGLKVRDYDQNLDDVVFMIFAVLGLMSFIILIVFTGSLVVALKRRLKWRTQSTADGEKSDKMSKRDTKTMKMVGLIAGVLIFCSALGVFLSFTVKIVPGFAKDGPYGNIFRACWALAFFLEGINSTVNIFFFYKMSSKFKQTFHELFLGWTKLCCGDVAIETASG